MHILHCFPYFIPDCAVKKEMFLFSYQIVFAYYFTVLVIAGYWAEEGWAIFLLGRLAHLEFQVHSKSGADEAVLKRKQNKEAHFKDFACRILVIWTFGILIWFQVTFVMNIYYLFWNFLISAVMYMLEVNLFFIFFSMFMGYLMPEKSSNLKFVFWFCF
jgi:hypothetical protein